MLKRGMGGCTRRCIKALLQAYKFKLRQLSDTPEFIKCCLQITERASCSDKK